MKKIILCILLLSLSIAQAQEVSLRTYTAKLTAQNADPARNFLDLKSRKTFDLIGASYEPERIDMFVLFGRNTRVNLMLPSSNRIASFGEHFKVNIQEGWDVQNRGVLVNVGNAKETKDKFSACRTLSDLTSWYTEAEQNVKKIENYQHRKNGPIDNLIRLEKGDVILFRSEDRNFYAIGLVQRTEESHQGKVVITWKIPRSF
ncbi:hypothetical protein G5B35_20805 [Parapusillimonas sp. SGNA-6]|uniref:hypothetical protein n=1 Tax=Parapedobacter sp. SGR-10 TaxID=2710879 RepID=UPI0013D046B3|nr:hypothetical protein [Parapedobacter sp. SGR-10]NGF55202.1 hypothetical protein [Parapedobacter sp. SGR-10]NGM89742.1 hypothetical protein [Parapusillimonas sp. SGNA-6]